MLPATDLRHSPLPSAPLFRPSIHPSMHCVHPSAHALLSPCMQAGSQGSAAHHSWVPGQLKHDAVEAAGVRGPDGAGRKRPAEVDLEEEMAKRRKLMSSSVSGDKGRRGGRRWLRGIN